ncbi:MAG: phosphatase PAP2 family protein [Deltaproteobacteria bacterium]|nr:phosphatase PAP2 family protein [Deltaproteobacteria bacterium]
MRVSPLALLLFATVQTQTSTGAEHVPPGLGPFTFQGDLVRGPVDRGRTRRARFEVDPVVDVSIIALGLTLSFGSQLVISSHELPPSEVRSASTLNGLDRPFARAPSGSAAGTVSDVLVAAAFSAAAVDTFFELARDEPFGLVPVGVMYAETVATVFAVSNLTKLAVRRPRPRAYEVAPTIIDDTLSFFSLHTAFTAALGATAAQLAFERPAESTASWWILGAATVVTAAVGAGRVAAGEHFPTDVVAGAIVGAAVGTLVPRFHRKIVIGASSHGAWVSVPID